MYFHTNQMIMLVKACTE